MSNDTDHTCEKRSIFPSNVFLETFHTKMQKEDTYEAIGTNSDSTGWSRKMLLETIDSFVINSYFCEPLCIIIANTFLTDTLCK